MGTGYTRNDTSNNIADGNIINASDLDGEFNAIESAMGTSGHTHDGTSAEGGPVTVIGPVQDFIASGTAFTAKGTGYDLGSTGTEFEDLFLTGKAYIDGFGESTLFDTTSKIQFRDSALFINSSADGQLDLEADTTIELTAPTVVLTNDLSLQSDGAILNFGEHDEVTVTHVHNTGLNSKSANGFVLGLQTSHTSIVENDVLGKIEFSSPNQTGGGDGALVGASIEAVAEATFSTTVNSSALVFKTNTTGAATERMRLTSAGDLHFLDSRKAIFGAGSDLQIYHDGNHSIIEDAGTGAIKVKVGDFRVENASGNNLIKGVGDVATLLNAGNEKLATTSTGVDITGRLSVSGSATSTFNSGAENVVATFTSTDTEAQINLVDTTGSAQIRSRNDLRFYTNGGSIRAMDIASNGDISFYEDQGSAVKFFWDASEERLGIGNAAPQTTLHVGSTNPQTNAMISARANGNALEWGHGNTTSGYYGVLGTNVNNGNPFIGFSANANSGTSNTYDTDGFVGTVIRGSTGGQLSIEQLTVADQDNQSGLQRLGISATEAVFNAGSSNTDFRVESNTDTHALFVDGETGGIQMGGSSDFTGSIDADSDGRLGLVNTGNGHAGLSFYRSDTSISANNSLGLITAYTNDTANNDVVPVARIAMAADSAFGNTDNPTRIHFMTTPDGSATMRQVARFDNAGNFVISSTNGTIYTETEGTSNLRMGLDAGDAIASGGSYNTFLGDKAGSAQTTGDGNTAVGFEALRDEDTHNGNTAIGYNTLRLQNVGANGNNTAVGFIAGVSLSTGIGNAFLGAYSASGATVTGSHNVGLGAESLYSLTSGASNVAIGYQAAQTIKSGHSNVAIGREALELEDDGDANVAIGYQALRNQNAGTGSAYNTAVGYQAGLDLTGGVQNLFLGGLAGQSIAGGDENTAVGMGSLFTDVEGSGSVAVGHQALYYQNFTSGTNAYNTAVGKNSGLLITTGTRNSILGTFALDNDQAGGRSVAVGYSALGSQRFTGATNVYNTAVGYEAGDDVTDGQYNTLIGGFAGDSMSTADFNTAVGYNSLSAVGVSGSNVAIGRSAGQAVTGSGNTFVGTEAGELCVAASNNTILGRFSGNQSNVDITTKSNKVVLSDGDGNVHFMSHTDSLGGYNYGLTRGGVFLAGSNGQATLTLKLHGLTTSEWRPFAIQIDVASRTSGNGSPRVVRYNYHAGVLGGANGFSGFTLGNSWGDTSDVTITLTEQNPNNSFCELVVTTSGAQNRTVMQVSVYNYWGFIERIA